VIKKFCQLARSMRPDDECVIHVAKSSSLMMEAVHTSETSVDNYFTWQYISEDNSEPISPSAGPGKLAEFLDHLN
jgi:hypothetical protein